MFGKNIYSCSVQDHSKIYYYHISADWVTRTSLYVGGINLDVNKFLPYCFPLWESDKRWLSIGWNTGFLLCLLRAFLLWLIFDTLLCNVMGRVGHTPDSRTGVTCAQFMCCLMGVNHLWRIRGAETCQWHQLPDSSTVRPASWKQR